MVPDREMIREIGEMGLCEPDRQLMPMESISFSEIFRLDGRRLQRMRLRFTI